MSTNYQAIILAEMKPDLYDGDKCDEVRPRWWAYADGDMEGDFTEVMSFDAKSFPPGTKITVSVPCCPMCGQQVELCSTDDSCYFDWDNWRDDKYS